MVSIVIIIRPLSQEWLWLKVIHVTQLNIWTVHLMPSNKLESKTQKRQKRWQSNTQHIHWWCRSSFFSSDQLYCIVFRYWASIERIHKSSQMLFRTIGFYIVCTLLLFGIRNKWIYQQNRNRWKRWREPNNNL
jgi:hypothetical protein